MSEPSFGQLPVPEVEIVNDEIRRIGGRIVPPMPLRYVDDKGCVEVIGLRLAESEDRNLSLPARVVDVSLHGVGIACPGRFDVGRRITLLAVNQKTRRTSFHEYFEVRNIRKRRLADEDNGKLFYVHGAQSLATRHSQLYKCILDSIFLAHANSGRAEEYEVLPWFEQPPPKD